MADRVTRTHLNTAVAACDREPYPVEALQSRLEVGWIALGREQRRAQQLQRLLVHAVADRIGVRRAQPFRRMVDRAYAAREPDPERRMNRRGRIEDDGARNGLGILVTEL